MFRSKKSMGKNSQSNSQANGANSTTQSNPLPNIILSPLSNNGFFGSTLPPNPHNGFFGSTLPPNPHICAQFTDSLSSLEKEPQFQSFTSLLQPILSTQTTILQPISNPSIPMSLPLSSSLDPSPNINMIDDELDEYENKLLVKAEIVDESGEIVRIKEMRVKDVFKLGEGEKILVHVDELSQPIKASGGLCTRFMTLLLRQPNICPIESRNFHEVKKYCGAKLVEELRAKFSLPCTLEMDKVIMSHFSAKFRVVKWRLKDKLLKIAKEKIVENRKIDGVYVEGEEKEYSKTQLLQALDIIEMPCNFVEHQWEKFKANVRDDKAMELSAKGKEARNTQVHAHTTGALSYARKKDIFLVNKKRKPTEVENFEETHRKKNGSYSHKESKELMEKVDELVKQKAHDRGVSGTLDTELQSVIHHEVWKELMEDGNSQKPIGYGVGVTKGQVSKLNVDLRKIRNDNSRSNEVHTLRKRVIAQDTQMKEMRRVQETEMNEMRSALHYVVSQVTNFQVAPGTYSNMNINPTLLVNNGQFQSQGDMVDHNTNSRETTIPSPHIPSP